MKRKIPIVYMISLLLLFLNVLVSHLFFSTSNAIILSTILVVINVAVIGVFLLSQEKDKKIYLLIFLSLLIKTLLIYFELYGRNVLMLPNSGSDTEYFYDLAINASWSQANGYVLFLKFLNFLFCDQRIIFQFINVILSTLTELIILKTMNGLNLKDRPKIIAMSILCFLPSNLIVSVELLRESLMIFINSLSIYNLVVWFKNGPNTRFFFSVALILLSAYFHSSMVVALLPYFFFYIFYDRKIERIHLSKRAIIHFILASLSLLLIYIFVFQYIDSYFENINDLGAINKKMEYYTNSGSGYLQNLAYNQSYLSLVLTAPIKFIYLFASPMPWDWRGINDILTFFTSSLFYVCFFFVFLKSKDRLVVAKTLFSVVIVVGLAYGMSCFSAGAAMRHREKILPYAVVALACCNMLNKRRKSDEI